MHRETITEITCKLDPDLVACFMPPGKKTVWIYPTAPVELI